MTSRDRVARLVVHGQPARCGRACAVARRVPRASRAPCARRRSCCCSVATWTPGSVSAGWRGASVPLSSLPRAGRGRPPEGEHGASFFDLNCCKARACCTMQLEEALGRLVASGLTSIPTTTTACARYCCRRPSVRPMRRRHGRRTSAIRHRGTRGAGRWSAGERRRMRRIPLTSRRGRRACRTHRTRAADAVRRRLLETLAHEADWLPPWRTSSASITASKRAARSVAAASWPACQTSSSCPRPSPRCGARQLRGRRYTWVCVCGADPLNLSSAAAGRRQRSPRLTGSRVLYRDGVPVASASPADRADRSAAMRRSRRTCACVCSAASMRCAFPRKRKSSGPRDPPGSLRGDLRAPLQARTASVPNVGRASSGLDAEQPDVVRSLPIGGRRVVATLAPVRAAESGLEFDLHRHPSRSATGGGRRSSAPARDRCQRGACNRELPRAVALREVMTHESALRLFGWPAVDRLLRGVDDPEVDVGVVRIPGA